MLIGYARVSTQDQNPTLQLDALKQDGMREIRCLRKIGVPALAQRAPPQLTAALQPI